MTNAVFPTVSARAGLYESFYLRAVSPAAPLGVWIRYTVHKRPGQAAKGSLWFTRFDAGRGRPLQEKLTTAALAVPRDGWIAVGDAAIGAERAHGSCGAASWSLRIEPRASELRHLSPALLYRTPLPRTKLTSPAPAARISGTVQVAGEPSLELDGWPGMVGHNWGSEHAARWIWLHGTAFAGAPEAWLDVALGRVALGGRLTPWVASGALALHGRRERIGGLTAPRPEVEERSDGCRLRLHGRRGSTIDAEVAVPVESAAGWRYADPDGGEHDVLNCSIAELRLEITRPDGSTVLRAPTGGAYELGMREHDHGVPIAPFADG